ncbi:MAG TPA: YdeI/OmpD-associated family protein [Thermoleophilia bacterium]|nr:YdeI/OmpD-associated family protein [Thermoleophilia bacterium]
MNEQARPEMAVPHDLQIALHDDPAAEAAFEKLPYSHQREYIDWILEARRADTRARRVDETVRALTGS